MKNHLKHFAFVASLLIAATSYANEYYDFEVDGIYYGINDDGTSVYVSYKDENYNAYSGSVVIPATVDYNGTTFDVTAIGQSAFYDCAELTDVSLPESITLIDEHAFTYCAKLASITIPEAVTKIGWGAFESCTALTEIVIPDAVTHIGEFAFNKCTSLASITFGKSLCKIGYRAFKRTAWLENQPDGPVYTGKVFYMYKGTMPENYSITLDEGTLGIAGEAFDSETNLVGISIPETVTTIEDSAFSGCSGLTSIELPGSLTDIGSYAFSECAGLTSIVIPWGVTYVPAACFLSCTNLASITIHDDLTDVGNQAFDDTAWYNNHPDGVTYLDKVLYKYKGTAPENFSHAVKEGTIAIADAAFDLQANLVAISIPSTVKVLGFRSLSGTSLTSITLPNSITEIQGHTLSHCANLASLSIGNDVSFIGYAAFLDCTSLMSFTSHTPTPPTVSTEEWTFQNIPADCVLYVPEKSIEAYRTANGWSRFTNICAIPQGGISAIGSDSIKITSVAGAISIVGAQGAVAEIYSAGGALLYHGTESTIAMPRGLYIVKVAGRTAKVVI